MASFGSGSPLLGNAPALSNAINNPGMVPQLSQVSANVPFSNGNMMPISPTQLPSPAMPAPQGGGQTPRAPQTEEEMIVKALISRLNALSDIGTVRPTQM